MPSLIEDTALLPAPLIHRRHLVETAISETIADGISILPRALSETGLGQLRQLIVSATWRRQGQDEVMHFEAAEIAKHAALLHLDQELDRATASVGAGGYSFDQAELVRLNPDTKTEPGKEHRDHQKLVWVFVISGKVTARSFAQDRETAAWPCRSGDLVLLRGPGFRGLAQERVAHSFQTGEEQAVLLYLRMHDQDH